MASVKTGAGRARARVGHAMVRVRGDSPETGPEDHGVVAMASVKTGAGRARARCAGRAWGWGCLHAEAQGFYPHLCDHWVVARRHGTGEDAISWE